MGGFSKFAKIATLGLVSAFATTASAEGNMRSLADRQAEGFWQTDRGRVADSTAFMGALSKALVTEGEKAPEKGAADVAEKEILELFMGELADKRGVHVETLLTALGALAGFSCQMAVRDEMIRKQGMSEQEVLTIIETKNGETYYSGKYIDDYLVGLNPRVFSVFQLVGAASTQKVKSLETMADIVERTSKSLGTDEFGVPNLPPVHMPHHMPEALLWKYWNVMRNMQLLHMRSIRTMPFVLSHIAQRFIMQNPKAIDPVLGVQIFMEAAVPMSRIAPSHVAYAYFEVPEK